MKYLLFYHTPCLLFIYVGRDSRTTPSEEVDFQGISHNKVKYTLIPGCLTQLALSSIDHILYVTEQFLKSDQIRIRPHIHSFTG